MKTLIKGTRCAILLAIMPLVTSCASILYVTARCDKEKKSDLIPAYNATCMDIVLIHETWEKWPGNDYVLPPWLDSSLNIGCGIIDVPISLVFDTITLPFQGIDYLARTDQVRLYADSEIKALGEKFGATDQKDDGIDHSLLNIVPNGETKKLKQIFKQLGLDPKRLDKPTVGQLGAVKFHDWRVSPRFVLSIMVAVNDEENDFSKTWNLNGYGVRIIEEPEKR
jgi:uncharacterized protein YceK